MYITHYTKDDIRHIAYTTIARYISKRSDTANGEHYESNPQMVPTDKVCHNLGLEANLASFTPSESNSNVLSILSVRDKVIQINRRFSLPMQRYIVAHNIGLYLLYLNSPDGKEYFTEAEQYNFIYYSPCYMDVSFDVRHAEAEFFATHFLIQDSFLGDVMPLGMTSRQLAEWFGVPLGIIHKKLEYIL